MRLIDADALKKAFYSDADAESIIEDISFAIEHAPTVDAVPVVRCKDCKYYAICELKKDETEDKRYKPSVCVWGAFSRRREPDWFCADGEVKE